MTNPDLNSRRGTVAAAILAGALLATAGLSLSACSGSPAAAPSDKGASAMAAVGASSGRRLELHLMPGRTYSARMGTWPFSYVVQPQVAAWLTTADGIPLASYGLRVAAYIIDSIIVGLLGLLVGGWFLVKAMTPVFDALGDLATATPDDINAAIALLDVRYVGYYSAVALILSMAYNFFFLTRWSATPGKRILGISVRRTDRAGILDVGSASRRVAFTSLLSALGNLPFIGFVALAATVADLLWPLSDPRRQALHDKVADTQVVVGHQKR